MHGTWRLVNHGRLASSVELGSISSSRCQITRDLPDNVRQVRIDFLSGRELLQGAFRRDPTDTTRCDGGARRDRTDDLLLAKQALSQLSYGPVRIKRRQR